MKTRSCLLAAWFCLAGLLPAGAASYTLNLPAGFSLIANQLNNGGNTLNELIPVAQDGDQVIKWDNATCGYSTATYDGLDLTWIPNLTLNPGEGAWYNATGPLSLTFTGTPNVPVLPVALPSNCCALVSRQTNGIGTYVNMVGAAPAPGTRVYRYTGAGFTIFVFDEFDEVWTPSEPMAAVGEPLWICCPTCPAPPSPLCTPPQITVQPANQTVAECACVTFSVAASGDAPLRYQWQRNGGNIPGANGSSYTICPVSLADNGAVFRVIVTNACGSATSRDAVLTVLQDVTPPHIVSVTASCCEDRIYVLFDELLNAADAMDAFNYSLSGGVTINSATLLPDGRTVCLNTDPLTPGASYTLTVSGVTDCAGNLLSPNPSQRTFTAPSFTKGYVLRQWWFGVPGNTLPALTGLATYPNSPDRECYTNLFELNSANEADNYGARILGWFCPPASGPYQFYLASDDQSALYLSTDCNSANKVLIAREPLFAGRREWTGAAGGNRNATAPENQSSTLFPGGLTLVAGQRYYIEAIMKEGGGGDHLAVAVQLPGSPPPVNGSTPIPGQYLGACLAATGTVTIVKQPADAVVSACCTSVWFMVSVTNTCPCGVPVSYQWQHNGVPIPGATEAMYCITNVTLADNGGQFQVVISCGGQTVVSQTATLTVIPDTTPPAIISANADCLSNKITLVFNDCLDVLAAQDPFIWVISGGVTINSIVVSADGKTVCLFTSPLSPNTDYIVTANGLLDQCGNMAGELRITVRCPCEVPICVLADVWRYEESGADLGTAWRTVGYNDTGWPQGPGLLGLEPSGTTPPIQTTLSLSPTKITFYFRKHFNFAGNPAGVQLLFDTRIDDGAVFYLNGVELQRLRMPASPAVISYSTLATVNANEPSMDVFVVNAPSLVTGANVLAVEVHQVNANSSDIVFGAAFTALVVDTTPPTLKCPTSDIVVQAFGSTGAVVSYTVTATDNVDPNVTVVCTPAAGSVFPCGTNIVTCTATDLCGNTTNCTFKVIVLCECLIVSNERLTCATNTPGKLNYSFDLFNNTGVPVKYLFLVPKTNCFTFMPGITTFQPPLLPGQTTNLSVMIQVSGACPSNLCFFVVALNSNLVECCSIMHCVNRDTTLPVLTCPDDITLSIAGSSVRVNYPAPTVTGGTLVGCTPPSGGTFFPGTTLVTCTATNSCGAKACTFNVTVLQVICPTNGPNRVVNGSFERTSPAVAPGSFNNNLPPIGGVPGWMTVAVGANFFEIWSDILPGAWRACDGTNQLEVNAQSNDQTVSQDVAVTTNCPATLCFCYTGRFPNPLNNKLEVEVRWPGLGTPISANLNPVWSHGVGGWQLSVTTFTPTASPVTIEFHGMPANGVAGGAHIDNVVLTQDCPCPPSPVLNIALSGGNIVLSWSGAGYRLQSTTALANPSSATVWSDVPGTSPVTLPTTGAHKFYRLVCP